MPTNSSRVDLATLVLPLWKALTAMEKEVATAHGLSMWGYIILVAVHDDPGCNQVALARAIGHDKTRIISDLDDLQRQGLLERTPDPADRRARVLTLTPAGEERWAKAQAAVHAGEDRILAPLSPTGRATFIRTLRRLQNTY
jgi:DNA-binding MarR family transcriptional regulator